MNIIFFYYNCKVDYRKCYGFYAKNRLGQVAEKFFFAFEKHAQWRTPEALAMNEYRRVTYGSRVSLTAFDFVCYRFQSYFRIYSSEDGRKCITPKNE